MHGKILYNIGETIGKCKFLGDSHYTIDPKSRKRRRFGKFECSCGKEFIASISNVKRGNTNSCGCYGKKQNIESKTIHGLSTHYLYGQWQNMKNRCYNDKTNMYAYYGGKGITVCEEWKNEFINFYNWAIDNGWKRGLSVDRLDNSKNYHPSNCRIANDTQQARNRTSNIVVEYNGEKMCLIELCEKLQLNYRTVLGRFSGHSWTLERAISTERKTDKIRRLNG